MADYILMPPRFTLKFTYYFRQDIKFPPRSSFLFYLVFLPAVQGRIENCKPADWTRDVLVFASSFITTFIAVMKYRHTLSITPLFSLHRLFHVV